MCYGKESIMKITNSSIAMASTHDKMSYSYKESATLQRRASEDLPGAILEISAKNEEKSYVESMKDFQYQEKRIGTNRNHICIRTAFSVWPKNFFTWRFCLIHLKNNSTCQRRL